MSRALYDLESRDKRSVISLITRLYKQAGYKRVPLRREEFVLGYTKNNMQDDIENALLAKGIRIVCSAEEVYDFYDDVMR